MRQTPHSPSCPRLWGSRSRTGPAIATCGAPRCRAALRRVTSLTAGVPGVLTLGHAVVNFAARRVTVGNRPVALKVLNRKLLDDPEFLVRFQNEAGSTGLIQHANVVTIYESGQGDDGTPATCR